MVNMDVPTAGKVKHFSGRGPTYGSQAAARDG
ncbi:protein of unknown function (plasmid) [Cupriavidus taiwanensis]|nr:protein of unknown function [Cupriavidus taiwanensis]